MPRIMRWSTHGFLIALICVASKQSVSADDWPQWLGPERDSVWRETGIIDTFPEGGPTVKWRTPVGGGYAGPAVAAGRVFVTDFVVQAGATEPNADKRSRVEGTERIHCLSATDGSTLWTHQYPCVYEISYASGPRATPTVDGDRLYALGAEGDFFCLNVADGSVLWSKNFPEDYGTETPFWGYCGHPLVDGPNVICIVGGTGSVAVAFDKLTGQERWRAVSAKEPGYCAPTMIEAGGRRQLVIWHAESINSLDPATGRTYWSVPLAPDWGMAIATPRQLGDLLFVGGIKDKSCLLRLGRDRPSAEVVWRGKLRRGLGPVSSPPFLQGQHMYGVDRKGELRCIRLSDGEIIWSTYQPTTTGRPANSATSFLVKNGDRFFLTNEMGDLIIAQLAPEGYEETDRWHMLEPTSNGFGRDVVWSHPAFANRCVFARNDREIVCVSLAADDISFSRDVRPILARSCFTCHGPDESQRMAGLRLDQREAAVEMGAIVPGEPDDSELVRRILSDDPDEQMPPESENPLTDEQKQKLRRWVAGGAVYEQHWAFVPPKRPAIPNVRDHTWPRNEIDRFILACLEAKGLEPSPPANRYTLVRRLYLDLIGLPPTPDEVDAFVNDDQPDAYQRLVDRLLESDQYGERWARLWLDLARYADTNGYEKDRPRSIWPYRDWVIRALNADMPFDQFTIEQLAGDMLPDATIDQRIATGFHRNTMLNEEGGIDPLEYRYYAMVDRVATTGLVWLGLTTGCAQCHSHKYDPISHTDYYRLMALLNNADEPDLIVPDEDIQARRREIEEKIAELEAKLPSQFPPLEGDAPIQRRRAQNLERQFSAWLAAERRSATAWTVLRPVHWKTNLPRLEVLDDGSVFSSGDITKRDKFSLDFDLQAIDAPLTALRLEVMPDDRLPAGGPGRAYYEGRKGDFFLSEVTARSDGKSVTFSGASHSYGKIAVGSGNANAENVLDGNGSTGWSTANREGETHQLVLNLTQPLAADSHLRLEMLFERHFAASLGRFRLWATSEAGDVRASTLPVEIESLLARDPATLSATDLARLKRHHLSVTPALAEPRKQLDTLRAQLPKYPTTMVMQERPADNPRQTFRHHRGEYLSAREEVTPGIPAVFRSSSSLASTARPTDRLSFARWLVSRDNPLVARVTVNRAWRAFFGHGIVRTSGDFGTQSEPPTHPRLVDWLACEFMDRGWSLKQLHRLIVTSATYRQCSNGDADLVQRDPENRHLGRGPRFRVDAEMVRDVALKASGRLSPKMYGPSVYPPQPASVTGLAYGATKWTASKGDDRFRRSLYTYAKRTAPFAAYAVYDAPTGENCLPRRDRSNTPLQALTLLNDQLFVELAQALAAEAAAQPGASETERAIFIFRRLLTRPPEPEELHVLIEFRQNQLRRLEAGELKASEIGGADASNQLASWAMVARVVMNLDETITKR